MGGPSTPEEGRLSRCVRQLAALPPMPSRWSRRTAWEMAENASDLLVRTLRAEAAHVRLRDPWRGDTVAAVAGATPEEIEAAIERSPGAAGQPIPFRGRGSALWLRCFQVGSRPDVGRVAIASRYVDFPGELDSMVLRVVLDHLAASLSYGALWSRVRSHRRERKEQVVRQAALAAVSSPRSTLAAPETAFGKAVALVSRCMRVEYSGLLRLDPERGALLLRAGTGWREGLVGTYVCDAGPETEAGYALRSERPIVVPDFKSDVRFGASPLVREHGIASGVMVPLHDGEAPCGVLCAHSASARAFTETDVEFLHCVANSLSAAAARERWTTERESLALRTSEANARLEEALRGRAELLGKISHELRTPLSAISGYLDLMELGVHGPLTPAQRTDLIRIRQSEEYLRGLVDKAMDLTRLESGKLQLRLTDVPVADTLDSVEGLIRPQLDAKKLRYERRGSDGGIHVRADGDKLRQIVLNLVSNAAKFTDPGGVVRVECAAEGSTVKIRIRDTGRGIPQSQLEKVFEPFFQVGEVAAPEGVGLGLSISRQLAAAMHGRILVESEVGKGSVFTLVLPRAA